MKRTLIKKLSFKKEIVKHLKDSDLAVVEGAATATCGCQPSFSCEASCTTTRGTCAVE